MRAQSQLTIKRKMLNSNFKMGAGETNKDSLHDYFYLILFGIIILQLFFIPSMRLGVATSILIMATAINWLISKRRSRSSIANKIVHVYIIYNTATVAFYAANEIPLSVFFAEWSNSILPVIFYYFAQEDHRKESTIYKVTLQVLIASFAIGFYLWVSESGLYRAFMDTTEGPGTDLLFFQSLFGLTATGAFGVIGFLISASIIFKSNGRSGKIALVLCAIAAILTFRRAALLVLSLSIVAIHYIGYYKYRFISKVYLLAEVVILYLMYLVVNAHYGELIAGVIERGGMISEAFEGRSDAWKHAFDMYYLLTGRGLGTVGHKALEFSETLIPDGNYFKIIAETGLIGFSIFLMILLLATANGVKNLREKYLELGIVLSICLIAVGSNILTYQSIAPIFWYSVGRLLINDKPASRNIIRIENLATADALTGQKF